MQVLKLMPGAQPAAGGLRRLSALQIDISQIRDGQWNPVREYGCEKMNYLVNDLNSVEYFTTFRVRGLISMSQNQFSPLEATDQFVHFAVDSPLLLNPSFSSELTFNREGVQSRSLENALNVDNLHLTFDDSRNLERRVHVAGKCLWADSFVNYVELRRLKSTAQVDGSGSLCRMRACSRFQSKLARGGKSWREELHTPPQSYSQQLPRKQFSRSLLWRDCMVLLPRAPCCPEVPGTKFCMEDSRDVLVFFTTLPNM
ncbi:uncharacterized protein LOC111822931 [Trichechus manatus latirostris]|uniref:Uncharacterized protein LOC111822931 n=1 Tax=Trichechus manatus latirostris TaxID=127582 RepID=A0A2Y9S3A6_TRIMA|nr:uncharacterized protein LOC111822931 [Trichechus manatus latirostris]